MLQMQSPANNAGLSDHDRLLILRLQQQQQQQQQQQGGNSVMDRESLLGMSGGAPGAFGGFGGNAPDAMNDRMLLQQLLSERRQASFENTFQQELQRQALTRELAERDYERNLLTQRFGPAASLGFGSAGLGFPGASMDPLGRSQGSGMDAATRLSLLNGGSQLSGHFPSPMLQGVPPGLGGGGPSNGAFGAPGLVRGGQGGDPSLGFDSSITLEARSKQAFPLKLYRMLERAERNGQDDIISFIDDGKAFAIHKPRAFETDIMPSYFNSHRMSSFQRQLNIYGFERINDGIQKGAYRHKFFVKGKKDLLDKIKRPQKLRHGGGATEEEPEKLAPAVDEEEDAAKLQTIAAEHLVGLSRTASGTENGNKSETEDKEAGNKSGTEDKEAGSKSDKEDE